MKLKFLQKNRNKNASRTRGTLKSELKIVYSFIRVGNSEEKVDKAFDLLFDEIIKNKKVDNTN